MAGWAAPMAAFAGRSSRRGSEGRRAGRVHLRRFPQEPPAQAAQVAGGTDQVVLQAHFRQTTG